MTSPVTPPAAPVVPLYPPLGSATFNADAYAYGTAMPGVVDGINDLAGNAHTNALSSVESAQAAQQSAIDAGNAAAPALAAANFRGLWPDLSGALNKPACVKHNGRFWMLLNNLQDVAESEPSGTSPDWTSLDAGTSVSQTLSEAAVVNSIAGVTYIIAASSVTVILPAPGTQAKGDGGGIRLAVAPDGTQVLDFNGNKYLGIAAGQRHIDLASFALNWQFENTTTVGYY